MIRIHKEYVGLNNNNNDFGNGQGGGMRCVPRYTIFCVTHCVIIVAHRWLLGTSSRLRIYNLHIHSYYRCNMNFG